MPSQTGPWTWLARIRRPQGRKGEVFAELLTDFPEKFAERPRLWLLPAQPPEARLGRKPSSLTASSDAQESTRAATPQADTAPAREAELAAHWLHKGGVVLHFSGVDSITAAEALTGLIVAVPRAQRAPLAENEAYIGDLIGCTLVDVAGAKPVEVGEIEDVDRSAGPVALLVVRAAQGEVLIPFAAKFLRSIDIEGKRIEMALPEGLVDLNAPGT